MEQVGEIKKILGEGEEQRRALLKQTLFTVAYYNALGYYPTSFFIWKNLIDIKGLGVKRSFENVARVIDSLAESGKIIEYNGMHKLVEVFIPSDDWSRKLKCLPRRRTRVKSYSPRTKQSTIKKSASFTRDAKKICYEEQGNSSWYKEQIQKNKISTDKIKRVRQWVRASRWVPYLRGLFLTGTLAMKRGGSNSDWDVLVVLKKNRIWLGRLIFTAWLQLVGKRRRGRMIENRFCLNQFVVDKKLKFKEKNEFFSNELLMAEDLMGDVKLKNKIMEKNEKWIKKFKPNFKFRQRKIDKNGQKLFFSKIMQRRLENILEIFSLAEMVNAISKKIMVRKIINNPKTYSPGADIRYSDFFLVFLPKPQRAKVKKRAFDLLTKMNL